MKEETIFEIGKTYKIQDLEGIFYTATILTESASKITFIDRDNVRQGLDKEEIKRWKEIVENRGDSNEQE